MLTYSDYLDYFDRLQHTRECKATAADVYGVITILDILINDYRIQPMISLSADGEFRIKLTNKSQSGILEFSHRQIYLLNEATRISDLIAGELPKNIVKNSIWYTFKDML